MVVYARCMQVPQVEVELEHERAHGRTASAAHLQTAQEIDARHGALQASL